MACPSNTNILPQSSTHLQKSGTAHFPLFFNKQHIIFKDILFIKKVFMLLKFHLFLQSKGSFFSLFT